MACGKHACSLRDLRARSLRSPQGPFQCRFRKRVFECSLSSQLQDAEGDGDWKATTETRDLQTGGLSARGGAVRSLEIKGLDQVSGSGSRPGRPSYPSCPQRSGADSAQWRRSWPAGKSVDSLDQNPSAPTPRSEPLTRPRWMQSLEVHQPWGPAPDAAPGLGGRAPP